MSFFLIVKIWLAFVRHVFVHPILLKRFVYPVTSAYIQIILQFVGYISNNSATTFKFHHIYVPIQTAQSSVHAAVPLRYKNSNLLSKCQLHMHLAPRKCSYWSVVLEQARSVSAQDQSEWNHMKGQPLWCCDFQCQVWRAQWKVWLALWPPPPPPHGWLIPHTTHTAVVYFGLCGFVCIYCTLSIITDEYIWIHVPYHYFVYDCQVLAVGNNMYMYCTWKS